MGESLQVKMSVLLWLMTTIIVGTGVILAYLVSRWLRRRAQAAIADAPGRLAESRAGMHEFRPALYQQPNRWLAIRGTDPGVVQAALHLHNPKPCSWEEGLASTREHKLFIAPPINGWILVFGSELPDPAGDVDGCFHFLTQLSRQLGHVQYFNADRILYDHAWVRAEGGHIQRAYAWAGVTLWNQGPQTAAERDLGFACLGYGDTARREGFGIPESAIMNVEKIPGLAARWSINPAGIDERICEQAGGIAGEASAS